MKVVIVGSGASGILCALNISKKYDILLIDKDDIAKKLLVTGNGRCNYFHDPISLDKYVTDDKEYLKEIFDYQNTFKYLTSLGIYPQNKNGYLYPYSMRADSIRNIFLENLNVKFKKMKITNIIKKDKFIINPGQENITCDKLVLALGSKAYKGTDLGEKLLKNYNFIPFKPALTGLICQGKFTWSGIRCPVKLTLYADNLIKEEAGEIQLTDYGISGICVFNLSLYIKENSYILINFLPEIKNVKEFLIKRDKMLKKNIKYLLLSLLNERLIDIILDKSKIKNNLSLKDLTHKQFNDLINNLTKYKVDVIRPNDFSKAQVSLGGLSLKEINKDFSLKKDKDLYVIGELLNVTGQCGGYNLAFAFSSGYKCGREI